MDKKPKKRKLKKMNSINYKRKRSSGSDTINDVSRRVLELMEKRKENFFVIRLHTQIDAANLPVIVDPDSLMSSDLMDGRDKFLCLAREKHLEFSSVRRAKFSTLVFCYELHQEQKNSILYTCNACSKQIEIRYTCKQCEDFELCLNCYSTETHPHPLFKIDPDEESSSSNSLCTNAPTSELQDTTRARMVRYSQSLQHACQCRDVNCRINFCAKMKGMIKHLSCCSLPKNTCNICLSFLRICFVHAKFCNDPKCQVPNCLALRFNWKQQGSQQRMQQAQLLRRRVALMQRGISSDPTPVSIVSTTQSVEISQPTVTSMYEPDLGTKTNMLTDSANIAPSNQTKTYISAGESNNPSYNNIPSNIGYVAEIRITDDDLRTVLQQYNLYHRNYPIKEEFQKYFGDWVNSNARYKKAYDILLMKSRRQSDTINANMYQNISTIREAPLQKTVYQNYSQPQWQNDNMTMNSYPPPGSYGFHNVENVGNNNLVYDYNNMKQQQQRSLHVNGNPVYIASQTQNLPPSQSVLSSMHQQDSMHLGMMPKMSFQPGAPYINGPSYMNNFTNNNVMSQCMSQAHSGMQRFPSLVTNNVNHKVAQPQNFRSLPIMQQQQQQQHQQSFHDNPNNNVMSQKHSQLQQPSFPQYYSSQMDQMSAQSGSNSPGIMSTNYGSMNGQILINSSINPAMMHQQQQQQQSHQNVQQQAMIHSMLIPSNQ